MNMNLLFDKVLYVLVLFDNDVRRDVFIGITALLIAVIIFVSELISRQEDEVNRRTYLMVLGIGWKPIMIICTMAFMMVCSICKNCDGTVYFCLQLILNIAIALSIIMTAHLFYKTVRIIVDKKYNEECITKYVYSRIRKIQNNERKKENSLTVADRIFNDYVKNNEEFSYQPLLGEKANMIAIKPVSHGRIEKIEWNYINRLKKRELFNKNESDINTDRHVYFVKRIGDLVTEETTIAYCTAGNERFINNINKAITISTKYSDSLDEVQNISNTLLNNAGNSKGVFDENNRAINYYSYICENNYAFAKDVFYSSICDYSRYVANKQKNLEYAHWLANVSYKAFQFNSFDDYCKYNTMIESLYAGQLNLDGTDAKQVAYEFANNYFISPFLVTRNEINNAYYENLMCTLLLLIRDFVRKDEYEAIWILFDNTFFEEARTWGSKWEDINRIHFQFACGVMLCFVLRLNKIEKIKKDEATPEIEKERIDEAIKELERIHAKVTGYVFDHFLGIYDAWLFIQCFRNYYSRNSQLRDIYRWFDLEFEEQKYSNRGSAIGFDECEFLKRLIFTFDLEQAYLGNDYKQTVTWQDKQFYERLKALIVGERDSLYEDVFSKPFDTKYLMEDIEKIIEAASEDEENYRKTGVIDEEKVKAFKKEILKTVREETDLIAFVRRIGKSKESKTKVKSVRGLNLLMLRECFFVDTYGHESIAKRLGNAITETIESDYLDTVTACAIVKACETKEYLDTIENPEEYVLISDHASYYTIGCSDDNSLKTQNGKIHSFKSNNVEGIIIVKIDDLPILEYCDFEEQQSGCIIDGYIEYGLEDCAEDKKLRADIIKRSEWLREKGSAKEQDEYLKQQCRLRLFIAYRVIGESKSAILINP